MPKTKVEVYDKNQLIYPFIESDHVTFSNGMKVTEMLDQSISMPTVTHEDLSFKVGVGDQDVSNAIVDSSVSEMTIKGKTYQNILPEPSTHVLTNNKEMFKVNEGVDPSVEIVDGVSKSAILSGSTKYRDISSNKIYDSYETATNVWSENKYKLWSAQDGGTTSELNGTIASGTDIVTLDFHAINHSTYKLTGNCTYKKVVFYDSNQTFISSTRTAATTDDLVVNNIPSNARYVRFAFFPYADNTGSCSIVDENNNPINLRQIQLISCKMPILTTTGKNLFDGILEDGMIDANGILGSGGIAKRSVNYIKVKPKTTYTLSCSNGYTHLYIHEYDSNYNSIVEKSSNTFTTESSTMYIKFNSHATLDLGNPKIQLEEYSQATPYEPHKTNILHTPEEVVLRSVENAQDTINLNTGEYVQRIGEVILNGSESWQVLDNNAENTIGFTLRKVLPLRKTGDKYVKVNCDKLPSYKENLWNNDKIGCVAENNINQDLNDTQLQVRVLKSTLSTQDTNGFKSWLQTNPLTIQYILETPVVKTVDLSTSGNWEKVVLDGKSSENWQQNSHSGNFVQFEGYSNFCLYSMNLPVSNGGLLCDKLSYYGYDSKFRHTKVEGISDGGGYRLIFVRVKTEKLPTNDVAGFKQWLSQNPIKVSYMLSSNKDSTQVKQPIFFKDGHIQLSSGADNSLIPTLDYQAKTSNSYVMDLMKTSTRYTMKAKSASGTFTIDGTSYGVGTNGTFTTPSSMTNKFLVMSSNANEEVMIIEGDVTSKTIPYFKGIKSAFEDKSKIEVLSTGKNWVNLDNARLNSNHQKVVTRIENGFNIKFTYNGENFAAWDNAIKIKVNVKPNTDYTVSLTKIVRKDPYGGMSPQPTWVTGYTWVRKGDSNNETFAERNLLDGAPTTMKFNSRDYDYVTLDICSTPSIPVQDGDFDIVDIQIEESSSATVYESYKSNSTKIPLLSPLRSLPNGVCDEIILDREKNKGTLIQRVGVGVLDGTQSITMADSSVDTSLYQPFYCGDVFGNMAVVPRDVLVVRCDKLLANFQTPAYRNLTVNAIYQYTDSSARLAGQITRKDLGVKGVNDWFRANPTTVYYQLAIPVVTEIDLEGFPYIYKDGHIFLNSEIAPTMEITYSINQGQQISASNEDIIRHEKELTYLQKLIAQYVQVDYESVLLSLKV